MGNAELPVDGAAVGGALLTTGVAVADDPQANNRATNNRTIALGQCLTTAMPDPDLVMVLTPVATICYEVPVIVTR